ncbi:MAG: hypothetical protein RIQ70_730 [Bacteroidota bacterium]|jgi:hypothetical protein
MKILTVFMVLLFLTNKTFGQLNYYVGDYTGNGNSTQAITGIGFKPDVIIIKGEDAVPPIICTSSMASGYSKDMSIVTNTATVSTFISSIDANGFTVKLNAASNTNHTVYYFICIKSQGGCKVGSYVGTGANNAVTGLGFQPEVIFLVPDFAAAENVGVCMSMRGKSVQDMTFSTGAAYAGTMITSFDAEGFTAAATYGSKSGSTYHYVAINDDASTLSFSTYTGNATADDRNITTSLTPSFLLIVNNTTPYTPAARFATQIGDKSFPMHAAGVAANDYIQAFNSSPTGFQVGSKPNVNTNGNVFYYFGIGGTSLSVEMLNFKALIKSKNIVLTWQTTSEINSKSFSIFHGIDGKKYEIIGNVNSNGNSNKILDYSFEDKTPATGLNYYKLIEIDEDGKTQKAKTLVINYDLEFTPQLYPNPYNENTTLVFYSSATEIYTLDIMDAQGKTIHQNIFEAAIGINKYHLVLTDVPHGLYFLKLINEKGIAILFNFKVGDQ